MSDLTRLHTMDLFSRFFQENREKFLTFAYSYLRDRAEAEDVLMESMITLWENRDRWEEDSNSHSQRELSLRISTLKACEPEQIFDNEIQHIVHKALEHMPQQSRTIFMLSRYQNLPNRQIAEQLHISLKTVEAHITKALRILRLELKDYLASILL